MKISATVLPLLLLFFSCDQSNTTSGTATMVKDTTITTPPGPQTYSADSPGAAVPANRLIVAGKSIGLTSIGQKAEETGKNLGKPDEGDAAMGKSLSTWYSKNNPAYKTQVFSVIQFGKDEDMPRVKTIRVNNPFFETAAHLKAGSNLKDILAQYPALLLTGSYESANRQTVKVYDDSEAGIAFEIDDAETCVGICIHPIGEKAFMQYLPFESSFKPVDN